MRQKLDDKVSVLVFKEDRELLEREAARDGHRSISAVIRKLIRQLAEAEKAA